MRVLRRTTGGGGMPGGFGRAGRVLPAVMLLLSLSMVVGYAAGSAALQLPGWPWWGPRVQVGERQFRVQVKVPPAAPLTLTVWDVSQPASTGPGWEGVLHQAVQVFKERYPALTVEVRILRWSEFDEALRKALADGKPPDVVGTGRFTYRVGTAYQVPLERYLADADPASERNVMPAALELATSVEDGHLWGIPRWVEWSGWLIRQNVQSVRAVGLDLANPATWRYLVLTLAPPGPSLWAGPSLRAAADWLQATAQARRLQPGGGSRGSALGLLWDQGAVDAAGPVTGRLAWRLGVWPAPASAPPVPPPGTAGQAPVMAGRGGESRWGLAGTFPVEGGANLPGPALSASSYLVFAGPEATDRRVRAAAELAIFLARWTSQEIVARDGVISAWNPLAPRTPLEYERAAREEPPPAGPATWWSQLALPPGTAEALERLAGQHTARIAAARSRSWWRRGPAPDAQRAAAVAWGALDWQDALHETARVVGALRRQGHGMPSDLSRLVDQLAARPQPIMPPEQPGSWPPGAGPDR